MPFLETTSHVRGDPWGKKKQRGGFNSLCEQTVDTVTHHIQTNLQQTKHKWGQTERQRGKTRRWATVTVNFTVLAFRDPSFCAFSSCCVSCWHHKARGTKPWEEAAGGAVMAIRVPASSPFTVLLRENRLLKQKVPEADTRIHPLPATNQSLHTVKAV